MLKYNNNDDRSGDYRSCVSEGDAALFNIDRRSTPSKGQAINLHMVLVLIKRRVKFAKHKLFDIGKLDRIALVLLTRITPVEDTSQEMPKLTFAVPKLN